MFVIKWEDVAPMDGGGTKLTIQQAGKETRVKHYPPAAFEAARNEAYAALMNLRDAFYNREPAPKANATDETAMALTEELSGTLGKQDHVAREITSALSHLE